MPASLDVFVRDAFGNPVSGVDIDVQSLGFPGIEVAGTVLSLSGSGNATCTMGLYRLVITGHGWYRLFLGSDVLVDRYSPGLRPPGTGTVGLPYRIKWRIESNYGRYDHYAKVWHTTSPEPVLWQGAAWHQSTPISLPPEWSMSSLTWGTISDTTFVSVNPLPRLPKPSPYREVDLTTDLHIPYSGQDVSLILAQALARVPAGSVVYAEPNGVYGLEQECTLQGLSGIMFIGQGARFQRTLSERQANIFFNLRTCANLAFEDLEIAGNEPTWTYSGAVEYAAGFRVGRGSRNIRIGGLGSRYPLYGRPHDIYVHHIGGDAIQGDGVSEDILAQRVAVSYCRRQGMSFNNNRRVLVQDCAFEWIGRSIIDFEPYTSTWVADAVTVRRIYATHFYNYLIAAAGDGSHEGTLIEDCEAVGGLGFGIIGSSNRVATNVIVRRNRYTWDDPGLVQTRNLGDIMVRCSTDVDIHDNDMTFLSGTSADFFVAGGKIAWNTFRGVQNGMVVDTGGFPERLDPNPATSNIVLNRSGQPAPIVVR